MIQILLGQLVDMSVGYFGFNPFEDSNLFSVLSGSKDHFLWVFGVLKAVVAQSHVELEIATKLQILGFGLGEVDVGRGIPKMHPSGIRAGIDYESIRRLFSRYEGRSYGFE